MAIISTLFLSVKTARQTNSLICLFPFAIIQLIDGDWARNNAGCGFGFEKAVTAEAQSSKGI